MFKYGKEDSYPHDRYLTFTEAASLLGSGKHTRVHNLVIKGDLPAYSIPLTKKLRVKKSELLTLFSAIKEKGNP
ncbi:helix-turn-helix domain-containing protein [Candidatus Seribacter sulfatis]|jgi:excisionase family DNA binding protein|uniref:helix-turn-helix domain-containing protein n=1 Tax=Candidatus Seribacter sulfatis TaxID=3381756 RepID=UPI00389A9C10